MKEGRTLLVQCCHLPHFFYVAARLRERNPGILLDALLIDHPQARFYSRVFPLFENTFFGPSDWLSLPRYQKVVLPLVSRGYRNIKRAALSVADTAVESDFEASLHPLSRLNVIRSTFQAIYSPTLEFQEYLATFPHRPGGEKILLVRSCSSQLLDALAPVLQQFLPEPCELTRVDPAPAGRIWRKLRKESFDSAFVFFSGERGFLFLKLLPFLLRVPKILIFNENGDRFYGSRRSVLGFLARRLWYGRQTGFLRSSLLPGPYILLIQTADDQLTLKALNRIRDPQVARSAPIAVFCRTDKRALFEEQAGVVRVYTYEPTRKWQALKTFYALRRLNLEVVAALLTGEPIFRLQKLLFFLLSADNRLVFNANLDCFYARTSRVLSHLRRDAGRGSWSRQSSFLGQVVKGMLFFPRFLFLVTWVTTQKLRRAYSASSEVK